MLQIVSAVPGLEHLDYGSSVNSLAPLAGMATLKSLSLCLAGAMSLEPLVSLSSLTSLSLAGELEGSALEPLANIPSLEQLALRGLCGTDLSPIGSLGQLKELKVEHSSRGQHHRLAACSRSRVLKTVHLALPRMDIAELREFLADCTAKEVTVQADFPGSDDLGLKRLPSVFVPSRRQASAAPELLARVEAFIASRLPRRAPEVSASRRGERAIKAAVNKLRSELKGLTDVRTLLPALRALEPDVLHILLEGTEVDAHANVVIGAFISENCKTRLRMDLALYALDQAGLLDGLRFLRIADRHVPLDLTPLRRHVPSLVGFELKVDFRSEIWAAQSEIKAQVEAQIKALPPLVLAEEAPLVEAGVDEKIAALLQTGDPQSIDQAIAFAESFGVLERLVEGCAITKSERSPRGVQVTRNGFFRSPCAGCRGSGARGTGRCSACTGTGENAAVIGNFEQAIIKALSLLRPGSEVGARATSEMTFLNMTESAPIGWIRWILHAKNLTKLKVPLALALAEIETLIEASALSELILVDADGDLSPLLRLNHISTLRLIGKHFGSPRSGHGLDLSPIAKMPWLKWVSLSLLQIRNPQALASVPFVTTN